MSKLHFILLVTTLACNACNQVLNKSTSETKLTWAEKNIVVNEKNCKAVDCAFADFRYVVFSGIGADSLNKQIEEIMGSSFIGDSLVIATPKTSAENFITAFENNKLQFPSDTIKWKLDRQIRTDTLLENIVSLRYDESSVTGGSSISFTFYSHFQIAPYKTFWLADFLSSPDDTLLVAAIAEAIFRDKAELAADEDLVEAGYLFPKGKFKLNENFHFTEDGLEFHYNINEAVPAQMGEYKLEIPYNKIERFLKPSIFKTTTKS
jgi:hypothetical protein